MLTIMNHNRLLGFYLRINALFIVYYNIVQNALTAVICKYTFTSLNLYEMPTPLDSVRFTQNKECETF